MSMTEKQLKAAEERGWKRGPMPTGTWAWGAIVKVGETGMGFYFADFHGDHVVIVGSGEIVPGSEIQMYRNDYCPPAFPCVSEGQNTPAGAIRLGR